MAFHYEQSLTRDIKYELLDSYCNLLGITLVVYPKFKFNDKFVLSFGSGKKKVIKKLESK